MNDLCIAIEEGNVSKVQEQISRTHAGTEQRNLLDVPDAFGQYPAHYAAVFGRAEMIKILYHEGFSRFILFYLS